MALIKGAIVKMTYDRFLEKYPEVETVMAIRLGLVYSAGKPMRAVRSIDSVLLVYNGMMFDITINGLHGWVYDNGAYKKDRKARKKNAEYLMSEGIVKWSLADYMLDGIPLDENEMEKLMMEIMGKAKSCEGRYKEDEDKEDYENDVIEEEQAFDDDI